MSRGARRRGFTLVEVLIALAIVAVGLGAAMRATIHVTSGAEEVKARTLAQWIAEDRLAENRARADWSAVGTTAGSVTQADLPFVWRETVSATVHPALRAIAIEVSPAAQPGYVLARLTGALPAPQKTP